MHKVGSLPPPLFCPRNFFQVVFLPFSLLCFFVHKSSREGNECEEEEEEDEFFFGGGGGGHGRNVNKKARFFLKRPPAGIEKRVFENVRGQEGRRFFSTLFDGCS